MLKNIQELELNARDVNGVKSYFATKNVEKKLKKFGKMLSYFTVVTCVLLHIALKNVE